MFKALKSAVTGSEPAPFEVVGRHQNFEERSYPSTKWVCTKRKARSRAEVQKDMFMTLFAYINGKNDANAKIEMTVPVTVSYVPCEEEVEPSKQNGEASAEEEKKATENGTDEKEEVKENGEEHPKENGEEDKKSDESTAGKESKGKKSKAKENGGKLREYTMGFYIPKSHQENPPKPSDPEVFIEERPAMTIVTRTFGGYVKEAQWDGEKENLTKAIADTPGDLAIDSAQFYTAGYDPPFKPFFRRNEVWLIKTGGSVATPPPEEKETETVKEKKNGTVEPAEEKKPEETAEEKKETEEVKEEEAKE